MPNRTEGAAGSCRPLPAAAIAGPRHVPAEVTPHRGNPCLQPLSLAETCPRPRPAHLSRWPPDAKLAHPYCLCGVGRHYRTASTVLLPSLRAANRPSKKKSPPPQIHATAFGHRSPTARRVRRPLAALCASFGKSCRMRSESRDLWYTSLADNEQAGRPDNETHNDNHGTQSRDSSSRRRTADRRRQPTVAPYRCNTER